MQAALFLSWCWSCPLATPCQALSKMSLGDHLSKVPLMDTHLVLLSHCQALSHHQSRFSQGCLLLMLLSHPAAGASLLSNVSTIQIKLQGALI